MDPRSLLANFNPTPDIIIIGIIILIVLYGMMMGQYKVKTLAMSAYVGIVIAQEFGEPASRMIGERAAGVTVRLALFFLPIIILEFGRRQKMRKQHSGPVMTMILCALTAALIISSGLDLVGEEIRRSITGDSALAAAIHSLRLWWIGGVPVAVVLESFVRAKED
jgi:hypothetical protein